MAAEIKDKFGVESELIEGSRGIFDVKADDQLVFSKHEKGRHAEHAEVLEALAAIAS